MAIHHAGVRWRSRHGQPEPSRQAQFPNDPDAPRADRLRRTDKKGCRSPCGDPQRQRTLVLLGDGPQGGHGGERHSQDPGLPPALEARDEPLSEGFPGVALPERSCPGSHPRQLLRRWPSNRPWRRHPHCIAPQPTLHHGVELGAGSRYGGHGAAQGADSQGPGRGVDPDRASVQCRTGQGTWSGNASGGRSAERSPAPVCSDRDAVTGCRCCRQAALAQRLACDRGFRPRLRAPVAAAGDRQEEPAHCCTASAKENSYRYTPRTC